MKIFLDPRDDLAAQAVDAEQDCGRAIPQACSHLSGFARPQPSAPAVFHASECRREQLFGFSRLDQADQSWRDAKRGAFQTPQGVRQVHQTTPGCKIEHTQGARHHQAVPTGSEPGCPLVDQDGGGRQRPCQRNGLTFASIEVLELEIDFCDLANLQPSWCSGHESRDCLRCTGGLKFVAPLRGSESVRTAAAGCVADR